MSHTLPCSECGKQPELVGGERIYPHRPDLHEKWFWLCEPCNAYVGCHAGTLNPLGRPAGPRTRKARQAAHGVFDQVWKSGRMSRSQAYRWLREAMGISKEECHIGMMNEAQARRVHALVMESFNEDPVVGRISRCDPRTGQPFGRRGWAGVPYVRHGANGA